jgi:hypothetical protein
MRGWYKGVVCTSRNGQKVNGQTRQRTQFYTLSVGSMKAGAQPRKLQMAPDIQGGNAGPESL